MVKKITKAEFESETKDGTTLIDFSATWCGPCKMLAPVLAQVSENINDVKFLNVDIDDDQDLAAQFNVQAVPTLVLLKDGKCISTQVGFQPQDALEQWINSSK
jgi:thioredoxin 1